MKILVAEDDRTTRRILEVVLEKWGYSPVIAQDGLQALERMLAPDAPPLALLDWMMPGLDGVEVCRRIREGLRDLPPYIILLTARDRKEDVVEGLRAGANDYVSKPFHNEELRARLEVGNRVVVLQMALVEKIAELRDALEHVRTLQGILPICSICKRIRNDQQSWERIDGYIAKHSDAKFSHGYCPDCLAEHYAEYI